MLFVSVIIYFCSDGTRLSRLTLGKLTAVAKQRMASKGKATEAPRKKRRVVSGVSILPAATRAATASREDIPPMVPSVAQTSVGGTVSRMGHDPPEGIPLEGAATDRPLAPVISLESEETGERGPPLYYANPHIVEFDPHQSPITPENGVEFLCSYGKNMLRSQESNVFGKMSTVDRIRQSAGNIWQIIKIVCLLCLFVCSFFFQVTSPGDV